MKKFVSFLLMMVLCLTAVSAISADAKAKLTSAQATKNIKYKYAETENNLIVVLTNKNKIDTMVEVNITFYGKNKKMLSTDDKYLITMGTGMNGVLTFEYPRDSDYNLVKYNSFKITPTVDLIDPLFKLKSYAKNISIKSNVGSDGIMANVTNKSNTTLNTIDMTALYYDDGNIIGSSDRSAFKLGSKKNRTVEFEIPRDKNNNDIEYDDYKIIVNDAYLLKY